MKKSNPQERNKKIIGGLLLLILVIYIIAKLRERSQQDQIDQNSTNEGTPKPKAQGTAKQPWEKKYDALPDLGDDAWLQKGTKAKEVWKVQWLYNEYIAKKEGRSKIDVDGSFGPQTETAVNYVNGYKGTRLSRFRVLVKMSKSNRELEKKKTGSSTGANSTQTTYSPTFNNPIPQPNPAESTFIYNPYSF